MTTLNSAIQDVDIKALAAGDQSKFDFSLAAADARLQALKPLLQTATFHLTGNAHIDAAWLWPWTETVDVVKRTFGTALQLITSTRTTPTPSPPPLTTSGWPTSIRDERRDQAPHQGRRWEIVGGMWVEPDLNMPDGESLVRQLLVGKRCTSRHTAWMSASAGTLTASLHLAVAADLQEVRRRLFCHQKMTWNDTNQLPFKLFWWSRPTAPSPHLLPHDYVNST